MLVGGDTLIEQKEVALAAAGGEAAGIFGKVLVSIAAALSAASAINATLFATARLTRRVADDGELPSVLARRNDRGVPDRAVIILGGAGTVLAAVGSLGRLVEAASVTFLVTFAGVNLLAAYKLDRGRVLSATGSVAAGGAAVVACWRLASTEPITLALLGALVAVALLIRPLILAKVRTSR